MENLPDADKLYKDTAALEDDLSIVINRKDISKKTLWKPDHSRSRECLVLELNKEKSNHDIMQRMINLDDEQRERFQKQKRLQLKNN